jgi:hypothetical protein
MPRQPVGLTCSAVSDQMELERMARVPPASCDPCRCSFGTLVERFDQEILSIWFDEK